MSSEWHRCVKKLVESCPTRWYNLLILVSSSGGGGIGGSGSSSGLVVVVLWLHGSIHDGGLAYLVLDVVVSKVWLWW